MEIVHLNPAFEPIFWNHVNQDMPHYFFFAFDWKYNKDETDILLALTGSRIDGMMLVCKRRIVQFRGNREATRLFLEHLDLEEVELQAPKAHMQYILEKYEPTWSHKLMLMVLHRGEERLHTSYPIVELDASDAEQIAAIMNKADPEFWGDGTTDQIIAGMSSVNWIGTKVDGELASICRTRLAMGIGHIATVATRETHRNKGYATSLVSHSVKSILKETSTATIYVLSDNQPAIRVYKKVGFTPHKTYYFIRRKRR
jgi:ribosomal protein S18 acetylase RimI-like enzyme